MIYCFGDFELDTSKVELRRQGAAQAIERQVFALLLLLVENRDRMVSKDEIIEKIWDGRIVSDSAIASRIKSARQSIGDDGKTQNYIKTIHGRGFRFVGEAILRQDARVIAPSGGEEGEESVSISAAKADVTAGRPSIAVLPFKLIGVPDPYAPIAEALPHDLISSLSRLRWLFVIARASSFRFRSGGHDLGAIGPALGARYCVSGDVEMAGGKIAIAVELGDTRSGAALWGERYAARFDDVHAIREEIIASIVSALEIQISANEALAARLKSPDQLDAWSAYHLGLGRLYRFNRQDNAAAAAMFERAISLDPGFARAHAGLSSTHFQNAFLKYTPDRDSARKLARQCAERAVELDPLDPFANFAMGRAYWIENDVAGGMAWLERSVSLSPNYAQGFYARAWADTVLGHDAAGEESADLALSLSPLDPFRYAMLGVKAFAHAARDEYADAAHWAELSARSPGAHVLIAAIALAAHGLNGDREKAAFWAQNIRKRKPDLTSADFIEAFPFEREDMRRRMAQALQAYGF
ncbi:MAG: transcriptional regulator [Alphaproteobacteria bacterium]|nr:transcriptional regulator [Alphaproteobacteria bacterium]